MPEFFAQGKYEANVCKLKTLYGLKQSLRACFGKFPKTVLESDLHRCQTDHSMFHLHTDAG